MNANRTVFNISMEKFQIREVLSSLVHHIIWLRSKRKVPYDGTAWFEEVNCDTIDLTYVRTNCERLDKRIQDEVARFVQYMNSNKSIESGSFSLEFYKDELNTWRFQVESAAWEVWTFNVEIVDYRNNADERYKLREELGELLSKYILEINDFVNNGTDYVPITHEETSLFYDLTFDNVLPYNFILTSSQPNSPSSFTTLKKFCAVISEKFLK